MSRDAELHWFWLSSDQMTVTVGCQAEWTIGKTRMIVVNTPPIVRRFKYQELDHLVKWMARQGGFRIEEWHSTPNSDD